MEKINTIIIGAGVVGLGVAAEIAAKDRSVFVIEKEDSFGRQTSSRNSEVIHAGIYYENDSLKAKLCVEGNRRLYAVCEENNIPHKKTGKLIVAVDDIEAVQLEKLFDKGKKNNVPGLSLVTQAQSKKIEPYVKAKAALYSESTGIIDTHKLMEYFIFKLKQQDGDVVYNSEVVAISKKDHGYEVSVKDSAGDTFEVLSDYVINAAGLESDRVGQMVGIDIDSQNYRLKYCKGHYFRINNSAKCKLVNGLVYPVPQMEKGGLGIHATVDLAGSVRLGPDTKYLAQNIIDYEMDDSLRKCFFDSVVQFMPFFEEKDLVPDLAGIRPKLQAENEAFRDFVISNETDLGFPGFINLIGIESPGLTASCAIAKYIKNLMT